MRAVFIARQGGPQALELRDIPDPQPGRGEVRIRVRAAEPLLIAKVPLHVTVPSLARVCPLIVRAAGPDIVIVAGALIARRAAARA